MFSPFTLNQTMNRDFLILLQWHAVLTDLIWIPFRLRNMLYQGPEDSSTPGNQVLPLRQVNVLAIYAESCHECILSDPTAVTGGADWQIWILSTCGICSTKDQKASQHLENPFWHYNKSMFCQFMLNQTMNRDFLILLLWFALLTDCSSTRKSLSIVWFSIN